ncbi:helix-turn-helix transcriptional regulator (plasmid) [Mycolicibacterium vanbaalenii]|uniref:helix-turn-helix transcriptional regulator n=1 Tax=Mycolicibacterium vanbaalenii TaxID=110539 RepID=UPI001F2BF231|nr:helix-turn-helix transcriptional regulator [Mycolicibacterium vanbaalenii]UJL32179.1 helix-turn-helix transcriptional regulator [Mycolicibacterium vanbaalenii]WND60057.1 helix-turn-helix transcriptional regulator [Mycolicibacterium vanbaalenii]
MNLSSYDAPRGPRMTRRVLRGFNAQAFAEARKRRGISVSDLARLADVSQATVFNWEGGKGTPQVDLLARVMRILEVPIEQVVTIAPDERYPGDWRVIKGLTQPELAAAAKIATTTLRGIERADAALTDANASALANLLDISVEEYRAAYQRARQRPAGTSV